MAVSVTPFSFVMKFLFGLVLLPVCVGIGVATWRIFMAIPASGASLFSAPHWAFFAGALLWMAIWIFCPRPFRIYVLGHELTHMLFGLLFGAKVGKLKVRKTGGSVSLSKDNLLISLSPYFFPFYTFLILLAYGIWHLISSPVPCEVVWHFVIGASWLFHLTFTISALSIRQSDVQAYGYLLSYTVIIAFNLLLMGLWIVCTTEISFFRYCVELADGIESIFASLVRLVRSVIR